MVVAVILVFCISSVVGGVVGATPKPTALVHIGPPKTGTTHLQAMVVKYATLLETNGYDIWPDFRQEQAACQIPATERSKQIGNVALTLLQEYNCPQILHKMRSFLSSQLAKNRNVLLSAEFLSTVVSKEASLLFDLLEGFHVHIVVAHRLHVKTMLSQFDQLVKIGNYKDFFPEYLVQFSIWSYRIDGVMSTLSDQLARRGGALSIIDYYGMKAANVDISYVIFCKVMNVLCHDSSIYDTAASVGSNPSVDIKNHLVANAFREFAIPRGCSYSDAKQRKHAAKLKWRIVVPMREYDMRLYTDHSLRKDAELREKYGSSILYGNRSANEKAAVHSYETVDKRAIVTGAEWIKAFESTLAEFKNKGLCNGTAYKS